MLHQGVGHLELCKVGQRVITNEGMSYCISENFCWVMMTIIGVCTYFVYFNLPTSSSNFWILCWQSWLKINWFRLWNERFSNYHSGSLQPTSKHYNIKEITVCGFSTLLQVIRLLYPAPSFQTPPACSKFLGSSTLLQVFRLWMSLNTWSRVEEVFRFLHPALTFQTPPACFKVLGSSTLLQGFR